ncbi:MAG: hypothetical protein A3J24_13130 [Deltaproteobacteria bacterium RIFCSPLOWO2_02_FULL_53_8]|nr:MAG: hypothetical protein A3J24_13130 [Deltaproteobacteria bacterium RIFCSPLOWO2_02_FULL_53_8]
MNKIALAFAVVALSLFASCNGGGGDGGGGNPGAGIVTINDIIVNPGAPGATALVEVTLDAVATVTPVGDRMKTYTVTGGTLYEDQPDFSLVLRKSAEDGPSTVSTKLGRVFWITPATPGEVTLSVAVGGANKTKTIVIGNSVATMSVTTLPSGNKVVTVNVNNVSDLFQAAFRVNYQTSKYTVVKVEKGDFLGASPLFIGLPNKITGVVPVSLTRKRGEGGVDGSGALARIEFAVKAASEAREPSQSAAFNFEYVELRDSKGNLLGAS